MADPAGELASGGPGWTIRLGPRPDAERLGDSGPPTPRLYDAERVQAGEGIPMAEIEPGEYIDTYINMRSKERQSEEDMDPNIRRWFLKAPPTSWAASLPSTGSTR